MLQSHLWCSWSVSLPGSNWLPALGKTFIILTNRKCYWSYPEFVSGHTSNETVTKAGASNGYPLYQISEAHLMHKPPAARTQNTQTRQLRSSFYLFLANEIELIPGTFLMRSEQQDLKICYSLQIRGGCAVLWFEDSWKWGSSLLHRCHIIVSTT